MKSIARRKKSLCLGGGHVFLVRGKKVRSVFAVPEPRVRKTDTRRREFEHEPNKQKL